MLSQSNSQNTIDPCISLVYFNTNQILKKEDLLTNPLFKNNFLNGYWAIGKRLKLALLIPKPRLRIIAKASSGRPK